MEISKTFRFEASHRLAKHEGKCRRLHGHSWQLTVFVEGNVNPETGFVVDYAALSEAVKPLIEHLDHHHLGDWQDVTLTASNSVQGLPIIFYPTSENLLIWIGKQLEDLKWSKLELKETCTSSCTLFRNEFDVLYSERN